MFIRIFSRLRPVTYGGREGRVAFGLLRHGAPVLALPKTRVVKRHASRWLASFASGQFHPAAAQSFNLSPSTTSVKGRRGESFSLSVSVRFPQRLELTPLRRSAQEAEFQISTACLCRRPFKRQPYKLSALIRGVNPGSGAPFRRPFGRGFRRGDKYKHASSPGQPSRSG